MIKDTDEQICWVKSGSILNAGASVYLDLRHLTLPAHECVLQTPYFWDIMEALSQGIIDYELHFQTFSVLKRMGA